MAEPQIRGRYTSSRDGYTYDYVGTWFTDEQYLVWRAHVRLFDKAHRYVDGQVPYSTKEPPQATVRSLIESSIESGL